MTDSNNVVDIFNLNETPIRLSYPELGLKEPMIFFMRPYLLEDEQEVRQAYYALTDAEKERGKPTHERRMLASLSTRAPENVPGFDAESHTIESFFADDNPMKRKVVSDVMTRYYRVTQPSEFFQGV